VGIARSLQEWSILKELRSISSLIALPANIRLKWKLMAVANNLPYYVTATIAVIQSLLVQTPGRHACIKFYLHSIV
jgi:hypothetical protein